MYFLYTLVQLLFLFALPYLLFRRPSRLGSFGNRLGFFSFPKLQKPIWIHAVSVGEVLSVRKLIARLKEEYPASPIVLSTITPTGRYVAKTMAQQIDQLIYFPFDFNHSVRRALNRVDPSIVVIAETEIWPNFLRICHQRKIPVIWINGRISDKSFPRYLFLKRFLKKVLAYYAAIGMQTETDRQRVLALGADTNKSFSIGNLKYDIDLSNTRLPKAMTEYLARSQPLFIAASTMPGEEEMVLEAWRQLIIKHPDLRLLIAPRHPERFDEVARQIAQGGYSCVRRSKLDGEARVILLDSLGELAATFQFARVVFVGGSLVPHGGHNILEPAFFSKPIVFGPQMQNFREMAKRFLETEAAIQVESPQKLAGAIDTILQDDILSEKLGRNARTIVDQNRGATEAAISLIRTQMEKIRFREGDNG